VAIVGAFLASRLPAHLVEPGTEEIPLASDVIGASPGEGVR